MRGQTIPRQPKENLTLLTVKQAAAILNLKPSSMPYHDAALKPTRTPGGARRYDPERVRKYANQAQRRKPARRSYDELMNEVFVNMGWK